MRKSILALLLALGALNVHAQTDEQKRPRTESATSPFTYEALGATPSIRLQGVKPLRSSTVELLPHARREISPLPSAEVSRHENQSVRVEVNQPARP